MHEKVKLFTAGDESTGFPHLERRINQWLKKNPGLEIRSRVITSCAGHSATRGAQRNDEGVFVSITVAIFYCDGKSASET